MHFLTDTNINVKRYSVKVLFIVGMRDQAHLKNAEMVAAFMLNVKR